MTGASMTRGPMAGVPIPRAPAWLPARRRWLRAMAAAALVGMLAGVTRPVAAGGSAALPVPASLRDAARDAVARGEPLVVLVSLDGCAFCERVRHDALLPLQARQGVVVQLDMRHATGVQDFDGTRSTHDALIRRWAVRAAPTVLFFDARGQEVAERLVGASIPDFYNAYLDDRLATARQAIRSRN